MQILRAAYNMRKVDAKRCSAISIKIENFRKAKFMREISFHGNILHKVFKQIMLFNVLMHDFYLFWKPLNCNIFIIIIYYKNAKNYL